MPFSPGKHPTSTSWVIFRIMSPSRRTVTRQSIALSASIASCGMTRRNDGRAAWTM